MLGGAAALLVIFVVVELRQRRPMFDLSLFANRAFCGVSLATFAIGAGMFAMFPYLTLYLQNALGYSPLQGGLRLLPCTILTFLVPLRHAPSDRAPRAGPAARRGTRADGGRPRVDARSRTRTRSGPRCSAGCCSAASGIGLANPAIAHIALGVVPPERSGMASGISNTFRIGGLATGVAALGAVFQIAAGDQPARIAGQPAGGARQDALPRAARTRRRRSCTVGPG